MYVGHRSARLEMPCCTAVVEHSGVMLSSTKGVVVTLTPLGATVGSLQITLGVSCSPRKIILDDASIVVLLLLSLPKIYENKISKAYDYECDNTLLRIAGVAKKRPLLQLPLPILAYRECTVHQCLWHNFAQHYGMRLPVTVAKYEHRTCVCRDYQNDKNKNTKKRQKQTNLLVYVTPHFKSNARLGLASRRRRRRRRRYFIVAHPCSPRACPLLQICSVLEARRRSLGPPGTCACFDPPGWFIFADATAVSPRGGGGGGSRNGSGW